MINMLRLLILVASKQLLVLPFQCVHRFCFRDSPDTNFETFQEVPAEHLHLCIAQKFLSTAVEMHPVMAYTLSSACSPLAKLRVSSLFASGRRPASE